MPPSFEVVDDDVGEAEVCRDQVRAARSRGQQPRTCVRRRNRSLEFEAARILPKSWPDQARLESRDNQPPSTDGSASDVGGRVRGEMHGGPGEVGGVPQ